MKILVIDIETTGFLPKGKIVEVGIVELNLTNGKTKTLFDMLIDPELSIKQLEKTWIVKNKHINPKDIKDKGAFFDEVKDDIQNIINNYKLGVTAYNRRFDIEFLKAYGIEFENLLPCPMLVSTGICKLPGNHGKFKWPKVEEAYKHFFPKSEYKELHRGADDAHHEAAIIYELHKMGKYLPKEIVTFTK